MFKHQISLSFNQSGGLTLKNMQKFWRALRIIFIEYDWTYDIDVTTRAINKGGGGWRPPQVQFNPKL